MAAPQTRSENGLGGLRGAYSAERAAALAGVPQSTVYYWARHDIYAPTLSRERVMLWSWADLLALRAIYWLRAAKPDLQIRATTMRKVRQVLSALEDDYGTRLGEHLANRSVVLHVDPRGRPYIEVSDVVLQPVASGVYQKASIEIAVDLLREYEPGHGLHGPHLLLPRPLLRIIPGKLGGQPHVYDTRVETRVLMALTSRGYQTERLLDLYPFLDKDSVQQAIELEEQLNWNLTRRAA